MCWFHGYPEMKELIDRYEIPLNCVFYPKNPAFIPELFRKMRREFQLNDPYREELIDGYIKELLIRISRSVKMGASASSLNFKEQKRMRDIRLEVLSHPEKKWTVAEMAQKAMLSPSRFHAVYKELFHNSPVNDLIAARIELAKAILLTDDGANMVTVAEKLGYNNQYHFIRQFKSVVGITPGAFQKNNR